jgi:hypothetical protein
LAKVSHESGIKNKISRNKVIFEGFDQCCFLANFLFSLKDENIISTLTKIFCERKKGPNLLF